MYYSQMGKDNNLVIRQTFCREFHLPKRRSIWGFGNSLTPLSLSLYLSLSRGGECLLLPPLDLSLTEIQSPTQSCCSLPSPYNSADFSGFFKNLEKWERIKKGLNKLFCYQDRHTEKKFVVSKSHIVINRQNIYGISWLLYFL